MSRRAARITYDEITRLLKGVSAAGLKINRVVYSGDKVEVIVCQEGGATSGRATPPAEPRLLREPEL